MDLKNYIDNFVEGRVEIISITIAKWLLILI